MIVSVLWVDKSLQTDEERQTYKNYRDGSASAIFKIKCAITVLLTRTSQPPTSALMGSHEMRVTSANVDGVAVIAIGTPDANSLELHRIGADETRL